MGLWDKKKLAMHRLIEVRKGTLSR